MLPDRDFLLNTFRYDRQSGLLFWRERADMRPQWNGRYAGKEAGNYSYPGRVVITLSGYGLLRVHRIIWKMEYGTEPDLIDHKDGNAHNNRLENLREASKAQNSQNMKAMRPFGFKGASLHRASGLWRARIRVFGEQKNLGYFATPEAAHAAYVAAAREYFGEFARAA